MEGHRFDNLTRTAARHANRRTAVAGALGIGAALFSRFSPSALAQQATPVAEGTPAGGGDVEVLFVQSFSSGTLAESAANDGSYTLTLEDGTGQVVYFSDRPDRVVGTLTDEQFIDGRAFDPADPPNAAIVTRVNDQEDILVVELYDPALDATTGTVTYVARLLDGQPEGAALASLAARQADASMDETLGPVTLFIDQLACTHSGGGCSHDGNCCSGHCCNDIETCPMGVCV